MKKLFTIDDFIIAGISGIAYGLGFEIPKILGYAEWQCILICIIVGVAVDKMTTAVVFNKTVQSSKAYRVMIFLTYCITVTAFQYKFVKWADAIDEYELEGYAYMVILAILGFVFSLIVRQYHIRKISKRYGDGSNGFVFDDILEKSEFVKKIVDKTNKQNKQIHGAFNSELAVKTKTGFFVGEKFKDTLYFYGIPYAKPPVDALRWKAPEPLPESEDVFEAKYLGASAVQINYKGSPFQHYRQSEDCLTLNISVGTQKTNKKKPVLVIFHHGDFSYGGSADPILYTKHFNKIDSDVLYVTFNYRIGIFGFIDFSEIPGGKDYPDALNLGLLDQIAALKWIKENISAFGGDPDNIIAMGFEAGAISICLLAASEQAKGLFQKAFIFYGSHMMAYDNPAVSRKLAQKLLQETSTTTMAELLQLPTERLKDATQKLEMDLSSPTRDEKLVPVDISAAYRNITASGVEFLIGISGNEKQVYKSSVGSQKYADFISKESKYIISYINANYPAVSQSVSEYLKEQTAATSEIEAKSKLFEQISVLSTYHLAKKIADTGNKVHLLYWDIKPLIENLGSGTVDILSAFLGNREAAQIYGNLLNEDIAEPLQKLFRKFAGGDKMQIFNNEIKGVDAIEWKEFPKALIISEKEFKCAPISQRLTEIKGLLEIFEE